MIENFLAGTATLFGDPFTIGIFVFGVLGGMLFGAIPGVSMLTLAAILLPFTADLSPAQGVMLFAVIYCTGTYRRAITAILFNIPGAPGSAHLPGMVASLTTLPVLGVPIQSKALNGLDSLLSIVQMPAGIPVGTLAIGSSGAKNASFLAA